MGWLLVECEAADLAEGRVGRLSLEKVLSTDT